MCCAPLAEGRELGDPAALHVDGVDGSRAERPRIERVAGDRQRPDPWRLGREGGQGALGLPVDRMDRPVGDAPRNTVPSAPRTAVHTDSVPRSTRSSGGPEDLAIRGDDGAFGLPRIEVTVGGGAEGARGDGARGIATPPHRRRAGRRATLSWPRSSPVGHRFSSATRKVSSARPARPGSSGPRSGSRSGRARPCGARAGRMVSSALSGGSAASIPRA